ncbi:MAG: GGDEF domain-containing response regulator, partial [Chloroflexota bacterium]
VRTNLEIDGYRVLEAATGAEGIALARTEQPALVVLDLNMPDMNGYEACRRLRTSMSTSHLPIVMLTAAVSTADKVAGMRSGADDYVTKPFDALELSARVEMTLLRASRNRDLNPLTSLPGNQAIEATIHDRIAAGRDFAAIYADLDHFKAFNDAYGFVRGDDLLKLSARCLVAAVTELGQCDDFVGHIGGDDFLVVTGPEVAEPICRRIIASFDGAAASCYDPADRERGFIVVADRRGTVQQTPLVSISLAVVSTVHRKVAHVAELSHIAAQVKSYVKGVPGSHYAFDRRGD